MMTSWRALRAIIAVTNAPWRNARDQDHSRLGHAELGATQLVLSRSRSSQRGVVWAATPCPGS